jgi:23S rRNA pseudouridine2605 synthase
MERISVEGPNRLRVVLLQGIKRQIRLMMYDCGYEVESLRRIRIGTVWLDRLRPGEWRMLNPKEVTALKEGRNPDPDAAPRSKTVAPIAAPRRREAATPLHKLPFQERPIGPRTARPSRRSDNVEDDSREFTRPEGPMRRGTDVRPPVNTRHTDRDASEKHAPRSFTRRSPAQDRTSRSDDRADYPRSFRGRDADALPPRRSFGDRPERKAPRGASARPAFAPREKRFNDRDDHASRVADKRPPAREETRQREDRPRFAASDRPRRATPSAQPRGRSDGDRPQRTSDRPSEKRAPQKPAPTPKKKGWDAWD